MAKRKIIKIDAEKCNGCGECLPNCPEGALQIIDKKARLISDLFCDGLGACIGHCPQGAITIEQREAEEYNEKKVMENIVKQGKNVTKAHLEHLKEHNQSEYLKQAVDFLKQKGVTGFQRQIRPGEHEHPAVAGCPGAKMMDFRTGKDLASENKPASPGILASACAREGIKVSQLRQWPVQIMLVPAVAPYLKDADLLIAADCVPFAYADFHQDLLKEKVLLVGCPKLDDLEFYQGKISQILKDNNIKSITCAHMEVPCCFGLVSVIKSAISASGKDIPFEEITISIKGESK